MTPRRRGRTNELRNRRELKARRRYRLDTSPLDLADRTGFNSAACHEERASESFGEDPIRLVGLCVDPFNRVACGYVSSGEKPRRCKDFVKLLRDTRARASGKTTA